MTFENSSADKQDLAFRSACIQLRELPDDFQQYAYQLIGELSRVGNGRCPLCNDRISKALDNSWYCTGCEWSCSGLKVQLIEEVQL